MQCTFAALILAGLKSAFPGIPIRPMTLELVRPWLPLTMVYALLMYSAGWALVYISMPAFNVFKNASNIFTAIGDAHFFGQPVTLGVAGSIALMIASSLMTGLTDLQFHAVGYTWALIQSLSLAVYVLGVKKVKTMASMSDWEQSYYNSILSVPIFTAIGVVGGEFSAAWSSSNLASPSFWAVLAFSGAARVCVSLSVFWLISTTSPTTYAMVGALNTIPSSLLSGLFFKVVVTAKSASSIAFGLASGVLYAYVKYTEQAARVVRVTPAGAGSK